MTDLDTVFTDLVRYQIGLWNAVDARLRADHGLQLSHFEPLQIIAHREGCRVFDIAEDMVISVGGTSKLVDRLEAAGHVRRKANPGDRRSSIIELTPGGRRLLDRATATYEDELRVRLGSLIPATELDRLASILATLRAATVKVDDDD
ncbi:MarR family winged helix-turn-helix transcriptional regulator [Aeromicrobium ginsengisoli]|uniref:Winged helix-turn-helix transcriptional regulator n=1 Tax=Aeromicrobium ginsengisoli TaxID=363867 RepID=A0A5M4FEA4_9ACTN|nr:MarR family winged helix-turn-helix transcriptional regulator [Aeromicrobium ginsengisoli]KAA1397675.1 winged helix-turn-helix transcriptional regulator [Aeromicrobium ginsengisoli]